MNEMIEKFLNDNSITMRLARTIVQGLLAVLLVAIPVWASHLDATTASLVTAAIMAVLSPVMAVIKGDKPEDALTTDESTKDGGAK